MLKRDVCRLFVWMVCTEMVCCELPSQQVSAMTSIYEIIQNNSNNFEWRNVSKTSNPCSWVGVGCSPHHSSIINISVSSFRILTSEFLPFVCNISSLESLNVAGGYLRSIPDGFLSGCGNLSRLKYLDFSHNSLYGPLPSFNGLVWLKTLDLSFNGFTGRIPTNLEKLNLLEELVLKGNSFTGGIPTWISNITTLKVFDASDNHLNGTIPSGVTSHLTHLYLGTNMLTGTIPSHVLSAPFLEFLDLTDNELEGSIPAVNSTTLCGLYLEHNYLNASVPWDSFQSLKYLELHNNSFTGSLPPGLSNFTNIQILRLDFNNFVGEIPLEIANLSSLEEIYLGNNLLSGRIPFTISLLKSLQILELPNNKLSGPIPASIANLSSLTGLHLENNQLSGTIPDMPQSLIYPLNLSFNHFDGNIPSSLSKLASLGALDLQGNNLCGPIPQNIRNLSSLLQLQLGDNQLNGGIPYMPESLKNTLNLSYNLFYGPIPYTLSNLWQLQVLDLSNNEFSGQIPDFLTQFSGLTHLLLMNNNLYGVVPRFRNDVKVDTRGNNFGYDPSSPAQNHIKNKLLHSDFWIAAACGVPVGLLFSVIVIFFSRRYHSIHGYLSPPNTIHTPIINFKKAMQEVSQPSNIILKARFSTFYKAAMPSDTTYLVNKFTHTNTTFLFPQHKQLVEELEILGELSHPNVMIPLAYVLTVRRAYLFYNFVRGTLHDMLHHRMGSRLDWESRFTIAVGVAKGLAFLHECSSGPIILLDLCSKSILLKSMDEPQISGIELCNLILPSKCTRGGSPGYVPPEYGSVTAAGNVYSFGVVLLELITGKPAISEGTELAKWVLEQQNRGDEMLDWSISEASVAVRNQMVAVLEVALSCINISPEMRPNSVTVEQMLLSKSLKDPTVKLYI